MLLDKRGCKAYYIEESEIAGTYYHVGFTSQCHAVARALQKRQPLDNRLRIESAVELGLYYWARQLSR